MKKNFYFIAILLFVFGIALGFNISDPHGSKTAVQNNSNKVVNQMTPFYTFGTAIFTDNMDGANDTNALKARGYLPYYRGTGPQGTTATWYQGVSTVFSAYNGPTTGYVAANYNVVTGANNIDSWLVLPVVSGGIQAGDSLYFYSRSATGSTYPDSIRVMYSANDSVPEGTWTELGRFKTNTTTGWELRGFPAPTSSANGRFAIRYCVANGGPSGANSDYIGVDFIQIIRPSIGINKFETGIPTEYKLEQNYPNPFNPVTMIKFSVPKSGNITLKVFNLIGKEVAVVVDENLSAGYYEVDFDASNMPSGIYFYKLEANNFTATKKMILIR